MGVSAVVNDGKITNLESTVSKDQKKSNSTVDKDQFMTLLVAQMKYQDPLEPTSNTEYISQYATFSELEQMSNMSKTMELSRASDLVGKVVTISPTEQNELKADLTGKVDSVTYSGNRAYVNIGGRTFSADDVTNVMSEEYSDAIELVESLAEEIDKLPKLENLTIDSYDKINTLYNLYSNLPASTRAMVESNYVTALTQYKNRMDELMALEEENAKNLEDTKTVEKTAQSGQTGTQTETETGTAEQTGTQTAAATGTTGAETAKNDN